MTCQLEFSRLCYRFILELRPIIIDYLKMEYHSIDPLKAYENLLNDNAQYKWECRMCYDKAIGDEIIDFNSIGCLFANSDFLEQTKYSEHESHIIRLYRNILWIRNRNAHLDASLTEETVRNAICDLIEFAAFFSISLNKTNKYTIRGNNNMEDFSEITVYISLFLEDFRKFFIYFCSSISINYEEEVQNYSPDRQFYIDNVSDVIDIDFIRIQINKHFDAIVNYCTQHTEKKTAERVLHSFNELCANRNNVSHETFGDLQGTINYLKDFYEIFGMDFNSLQDRVKWFMKN